MGGEKILKAEKALIAALGAGASPLNRLLCPQYGRELRSTVIEDKIRMEIDKKGFRRYKRRRPWPKYPPPPISEAEVMAALNKALSGFVITAVKDCGSYIEVYLREV